MALASPLEALLARRLLFVTGKGGVGKSTVSRVLARAAEARGKRTLLTTAGTEEGEAALAEYLGLHLPDALVRRLTGSGLYRRFVAGAPALRELMIVGKVADEGRSDLWDTIVVDMPATGHALEMLRMPAAAANAFGGLVRSEATRILGQLLDPARAAVCVVTIAEELPVREAEEASAEIVSRLGMALGAVIVNRLRRAPLRVDEVPVVPDAPPLVASALRCAREEAARAALEARWLATLADTVRAPLLVLSRRPSDPLGEGDLEAMRRELEGA
jgi:anion-transporting  ArsA/GET3 family ATPase